MNFHDQQRARRWQSALLLIALVLVLMAVGVVIHLVIAALSLALGQGGSFAHPSTPAIAMITLVWLTMVAGAVFRLLDVRAGGAVLARRFGAVHASDRSRHDKERQLLNIVAEISIASTTPQPDTYVLRNETSINAFIVGNSNSRPVIVVTEGALDAFDRDQLQAVVAHEFAHIANGDLPVNMRLLIIMGGLMAMDEVGQILIARHLTDRIHPAKIVGYLICSLGKIGVFAGRIVSAAFSRQREFLADATAVQYTRNPYALALALDIAHEQDGQPTLHGAYARELAPLCFQSAGTHRWLRKLMASHPEISLRIDAIEPNFEVKKRKASKHRVEAVVSGGIGAMPDFASGNTSDISANMAPSDRIVLLLPDEHACLAALFALFVAREPGRRRDYLNALGVSFPQIFVDRVNDIANLLPDELANDQVSLIVHVSGVLNKTLKDEQRQKITLKLEQLLSVDGHYHLMDYARVQLIRRMLNVEFPVISSISSGQSLAMARKAKGFDKMGQEFALLLSLMVETSGATPDVLDQQFQRVLKCYTQVNYPRRTANETGIIKDLESAFQTLYVQPKPIRLAFVQHCIEIMRHDGRVLSDERALLDLFAASLGCDELVAA